MGGHILYFRFGFRFNDEQIYAGGFYVNQSGLPEWVRNDADGNLVNEDVVVWHTFRATHIPRVEDFPVRKKTKFYFSAVNKEFFLCF